MENNEKKIQNNLFSNTKKFILNFRYYLQLIFLLLLNGDFFSFFKLITNGKATVSSLPTKYLCVTGLNCYSCPSAIGSCPIGTLQFYLNDVAMKVQIKEKINLIGLYILGFFGITGVLGGRIYCGWVCPFGFIQELINKITNKNGKVANFLTQGRYLTLTIFVFILPLLIYDITLLSPWFCKLICPAGTLLAGIPMLVFDKSLHSSISYITIFKFSILVFIVITLLYSNRVFCKTLCPLGAIWGLFNKIAIFNINYQRNSCINCNKCSRNCLMNLDVTKEYSSSKCIRCLKCVAVCPNDSLKFGAKL